MPCHVSKVQVHSCPGKLPLPRMLVQVQVKFSMLFRGREITHAEVGQKIMLDMAKALEEIGVLDGQPKILGKQMIMMISPKGGS